MPLVGVTLLLRLVVLGLEGQDERVIDHQVPVLSDEDDNHPPKVADRVLVPELQAVSM